MLLFQYIFCFKNGKKTKNTIKNNKKYKSLILTILTQKKKNFVNRDQILNAIHSLIF